MLEFGRTEEVIREMDKLANEDDTHVATEEELNVYCSNWWIRSNFVGSDTMPMRHRPDFNEALSTLGPDFSSVIAKCVSSRSSPVPSLAAVLSCVVEYIYIYIYMLVTFRNGFIFFCFAYLFQAKIQLHIHLHCTHMDTKKTHKYM